MLPNIIPDQVALAYATLRRTGFVGGLSLADADLVAIVINAKDDAPNYVTRGADADGDYAIGAGWDYMPGVVNHFDDDE